MLNLVCLLFFAVMLTAAQLLFKKTALAMAGRPFIEGLLAVALQPSLYIALAIYGVATFFWIWILSRVPLTQANPFLAVVIVLVPLTSVLFLGERVNFIFWVGAALVTAGVLVTQYSIGMH